jgi:glycosyltransferase involved in cell wall biosynthesis
MLYYGRKAVAEESLESFLRQTYPYKKLVIVNTHPDPVHFEKDYPQVEVHNVMPGTFKNLNEKYLYALNQVKSPWWSPWDSDDIWLPWHLENLADYIKNTKMNGLPRKIGITRSYFMLGKQKKIEIGWQMWGDCIWESFDKEGNFHAKCDPDNIENCDRQITFQEWDRHWISKEKPISFIFRWSTNEIEHRSARLGKEGVDREAELRNDMNKVEHKEPWRPHWKEDYIELTKGEHETFNGV